MKRISMQLAFTFILYGPHDMIHTVLPIYYIQFDIDYII